MFVRSRARKFGADVAESDGTMRTSAATRVAILATLSLAALPGCEDEFTLTPMYNHANSRVVIQVSRELGGSEQLFVRTRRGNFGELDCAKLAQEVEPVADTSGERIDGPLVDQALTVPFYKGDEWMNPTPEMIAEAAKGTDSIIDVCVMDGSKIVWKVERDLFAAWDTARLEGIGGKADDPSGEQRINSPVGYGEKCVNELGEIPFFEKLGDGEYGTYNCLDSTPIPVTVTKTDGTVDAPQTGTVPACDNPQYIYSLCEAGPRVATRINDRGTRWTLLCRKSIGGYASDKYNDIAMIGTNPFTGKTCFFQNALYSKTDGGKVPHPADKEKSANLWSGVHGGLGSGIQCSNCHDADAFIHSPWIDGAKDSVGRPIVPKMGVDPDFAIGANDTPYALVNRRGQGWTMHQQITAPEADACTKCHRMGVGEWKQSYLSRLEGTDSSWNNITTDFAKKPENRYWMPPDHTFVSDDEFNSSEYKAALDFIQSCSGAACGLKDIPETLGSSEGGGKLRNPVTLSDSALAQQAAGLLGIDGSSTRCTQCHTATNSTFRTWKEETQTAMSTCLKDADATGAVHNDTSDRIRVENREFKLIGPFDVAAGSFFEVSIEGTGDIDLYVKRGGEASKDSYDCRPFAQTSTEKCDKSMYNAAGPAKFWIGLNGTQDGSVKVTTKYAEPAPNAMAAKDRVDCFRLDPAHSDSPFVPAKLGIFAAGAHLGWFQDTFKAAYPADEGDNNADSWALAYGAFKNRSSMPKGNHPRLTQPEFDIVAEWFARGLPQLASYLPADANPTSCTANISPIMADHQLAMQTQGWAARNRQAGMNMYGCNGSSDPRTCLTSLPNAQSKSYGAGWSKVGTLRVLRELAFNTYYWMRSSPDGRFVANGSQTGGGGVISDLQTNKDMDVEAAYDPGFFPDGHGWMFQGTPIGAALCTMSLLVSNPDHIDFSESACSSVGTISLYQHLGAGLGGADYFAINSQFTSDFPGEGENEDPSSEFGASAQMTFTPMVFDGSHYVGKSPVTIDAPYEGDSVLSPSTNLVISRFGNSNQHLGYIVRKVTATPNGASFSITTQEVGRYCTEGSKPSISFDEKYFVTHDYVDPNDYADYGFSSANDPQFQAMMDKGTSNIIIVNLLTGVRTRVTNMQPGQFALYPHFRSDGWFYFLVRDTNTGKEYAMASDAALTGL